MPIAHKKRALQVCIALATVMSTHAQAQSPVTSPTPQAVFEAAPPRPGWGGYLRSLFISEEENSSHEPKESLTEGAPTSMESEASALLTPADYLTAEELKLAEPWRAPDFATQTGALGWSEKVFDVPEPMRARVAFWRDIYTRYTTNQGVIHDSLHISVVYTPIDFNEIMRDSSVPLARKAKAREKLVKEKKAEIIERLRRLDKRLRAQQGAEGLSGEDLRVWKLFEAIDDIDKFSDAATKSRVRFQLGQRDRFIIGIFHSGYYLREMEKMFRDEGLPIELTRLPFVESSFNLRARSRVGASGIWQFMPRTARPYMKMNRAVDERNDPLKSTRASARLLRQNYAMLDSWPLAVTGYNHGPNGVRRISEKLGTKDLSEIVRRYSSRRFGFASENFYACFLAALEVERFAPKYFGSVKWAPELRYAEVKTRNKEVPYKILLEFFDGDKDAADLLNSHLTSLVRTGKASIPAKSFFRVPPARYSVADDYVSGKLAPAKLSVSLKSVPLTVPAPPEPQVVPAAVILSNPAAMPQSTSGEAKP